MKKLKPIKPKELHIGCLTCSTACLVAPMDMLICVGFGYAHVTRDGKIIYDGEEDLRKGKTPKTVKYFEYLAQKNPTHDWRIEKHGPLHSEVYQRQGKEKWVCVESTGGFA